MSFLLSKNHHRGSAASLHKGKTRTVKRCYFSVEANTPKKNGGNNTNNKKNSNSGKKKESNAYAATVLLPQTTFEMRANSVQKEPLMQKWWLENDVYKQVANRDESKENLESFTLHDGPPYANGDLHIGHALNKILKDFITRTKR